MKNVLVMVHQDPGQEARLQAALDLTRALSGHLTCLDVTPIPLVFDQGMTSAPAMFIDESDQEAANKHRLRERLDKEDVSWSWSDRCDDIARCVIDAAKTADLVVLNRKLESPARQDMRAVASDILAHSDALIVAVPETCRAFAVGLPAIVAWDGSEQSLHAVQKAVILLKLATSVRIFQAGQLRDDAIPASEAAQYLSRHGVTAEIEVGPKSDDIAGSICAIAARDGAGFCVLGAFGHSRLRETLFGGVTRAMLTMAPLPLVLAH